MSFPAIGNNQVSDGNLCRLKGGHFPFDVTLARGTIGVLHTCSKIGALPIGGNFLRTGNGSLPILVNQWCLTPDHMFIMN